jgi:FMN reductase
MNIAVISCSLHPQSRSFVLSRVAHEQLKGLGADVQLYDLRDYSLQFCDATTAHKTADARTIIDVIGAADAVLLTVPIYNYDVNAAAKNLLELGMRAWINKVVGFICVAGGRASYMSVMGLANSLMLDFRCLIVPRFVYATGADFGDDREETMYLQSTEVHDRISEVTKTLHDITTALSTVY